MKILNTYYGLEAHNFNAEPCHACVRYDASEEEIALQKEKAQQSLKNRKCFWYLVEITEINPHTGEVNREGFFDTVGEKTKIVLNATAKKPTKEPSVPTPAPTLDDFMADTANKKVMISLAKLWDLDMFDNIPEPEPAPLQETKLPF